MTCEKHISVQYLEAFFCGHLADAAADDVIAHLAVCDHCLAIADEFWAETSGLTIPILGQERVRRVEGRLRGTIYRSNLGGQIIRLGTQGLLRVWFGLLAPFVGGRQETDRGGQRIEH